MNKKIIALVIVLAAAAAIGFKAGVFSRSEKAPQAGKIKIAASFYPLADFAQNVSGDLAEVTNITPPGAEPHDYEPAPQDIAKIYDAKLFLYNGSGVDAWADKIRGDLEKQGVAVIDMSEHIGRLQSGDAEESPEGYDPHFWLSPPNARAETDLIAGALIAIDPAHETQYNENRNAYRARLEELDRAYREGLADCGQREIVTSHNAFSYLAREYNFKSLYILGLSPDEEPSPKTIADTADLVRQKGIRYIFFETLVSPKLSQTIADETGAKTLELNPIEGFSPEEIAAGKNYISQMQANLTSLRTAMQCR